MKVPIKISKVGSQFDTTRGKVQKLVAENMNTHELYDNISVFLNGNNFEYGKGDEVLIDIREGEYKGKPAWTASYESIETFDIAPQNAPEIAQKGASKETSPEKGIPASVWEAKDERMVRMNCLSHAVMIIHDQYPLPEAFNSETERANMVKMVAISLRDWVYGDEKL